MYLASVSLLMFVFPAVCVAAEALLLHGHVDPVALFGRWFVFWGVGIRLLAAGLRQVLEPAYTAESIFRIKDPGARKLVLEIGFGNLSIGALGAVTLTMPQWIAPAALAGCLFYALAGIQHALNATRGGRETIAMLTDLAMAMLLGAYLIAAYVIQTALLPI